MPSRPATRPISGSRRTPPARRRASSGRARAIRGIVLVAAAATAAFAPLDAQMVERVFSTGFYPVLQRVLTPLTNVAPFALFDLLLLATAAALLYAWTIALRTAWRARSGRPVLGVLWTTAVGASAVYLMFLALWGLNYRRVPMTQRLELRASRVDPSAVVKLGAMAVERMNALHASAHAAQTPEPWRDPALRSAFNQVQAMLADVAPAVPGRLKASMTGVYFRWTSVDAMVNPFGLEVLVNPDLLPVEKPFVAAHEWAHLAGYADESEANFVGWLACVRGDAAAQYSGWLYLYWQVSGELSDGERKAISSRLAAGPRADIAAIVARVRRGAVPLLQTASWEVYDQYLKANRVESGVRSYGAVVNLILRARFEDGYRPVRRPSAAVPSR